MDRNGQYLIQHSIFKQDAFGISVDDLPTFRQRYKQTIAIVCLTASKIVTKAVLGQPQIWCKKPQALSTCPSQREGAIEPLSEARQVGTCRGPVQVPHRECTRYRPQHVTIAQPRGSWRISRFPAQNLKVCSAGEEVGCTRKYKGRRNPANRGRHRHGIIRRGSAPWCGTHWKVEVGIST